MNLAEAKSHGCKPAIHEIVYRAVMDALKVAQPRLPEAGATPIALNAAIKASTLIDQRFVIRDTAQ